MILKLGMHLGNKERQTMFLESMSGITHTKLGLYSVM